MNILLEWSAHLSILYTNNVVKSITTSSTLICQHVLNGKIFLQPNATPNVKLNGMGLLLCIMIASMAMLHIIFTTSMIICIMRL